MPVTRLEVLRALGAPGNTDRFLNGAGSFRGVQASRYVHEQADPLQAWTVVHNLGCYPSVVVTDGWGNQVFADLQYISANVVRVTHGRPESGRATCM